jgi:hypothetical protein
MSDPYGSKRARIADKEDYSMRISGELQKCKCINGELLITRSELTPALLLRCLEEMGVLRRCEVIELAVTSTFFDGAVVLAVKVPRGTTLDDVKEIVSKQAGCPAERQRYFNDTTQLANEHVFDASTELTMLIGETSFR